MSQDADRKRIEAAVQECYSTWGTSYYSDYYGPSAPYPPVHIDLLRRVLREAGVKSVVDAGCGPASFLRHLATDGLDLYGFDLTVEMITEAKRVFGELKLDPARVWQGSVLDPRAYAPPDAAAGAAPYDGAVCVGVLPHIAEEHEAVLFANLASAVRPDGLVIVEARNQLFSLFTLNRPSYEFFAEELVGAASLRARAGEDAAKVDAALEAMKAGFRMDLPPIRRGKSGEPGYDEVLSRTHNPFTLRAGFEAAGFSQVRTLFYHYHALPPMVSGFLPELFLRESIAMERPDDWRGHFMASAFLLCGVRH